MASTKDMMVFPDAFPGVASRGGLSGRGKRIELDSSISLRCRPGLEPGPTPRPLDLAKCIGYLASIDGTTRYGSRLKAGTTWGNSSGFLPSPLVGEVARTKSVPDEGSLSAETAPSPVRDASP